MKIHFIILPLMTLALMVGCKQAPDAGEVVVPVEVTEADKPTMDELAAPVERVPVLQKAKSATKPANSAPAASTTPKAPVQPPLKGTIYVETDGAQGRVWGHVTMNGDRGTGTIHDWDENTWAVSVTRHGDELFAVDQNSRLYVFKLKQNKTQQ